MNPFNRIKSYSKHFGNGMISSLPVGYFIHPKSIKNQGKDTDKCSFYAIASCFEALSESILDPDSTYNLAKKKQSKVGFLLDWACSFACENGFLDISGQLFKHTHLKPFKVDGSHDTFDNIKSALHSTKTPVVCSAYWRPEWTFASKGLIQSSVNKSGEPHAFCVIGWSEDRLIVQNSRGESVGDKGLFYFPIEIVNKDFIDSYCFKEVVENEPFTLNMFKKIVSSLLKCYNK